MRKIPKPHFTEHALFYEQYIIPLKEDISVLQQLKDSGKEIVQLYKSLSVVQQHYRYAEGKWSPKDILLHLSDVERVFTHRAMRFARGDRQAQSFFDENEFVKAAQADKVHLAKLLRLYQSNRAATLAFFQSLSAAQLKAKGIAGMTPTSVRACLWIILGHERHHLQVLPERYGIGNKSSCDV